ncbi:MAG: hypothetical protein ACLSHX_08875 [Suilimivivens sp.]
MNKRKIVSFIGRIILIEAALMVLPLLVALYYGDGDAWVFAVTILAALIPGVLMARVRQSDRRLSSRDGYFIVAATWIIISLIGAMPLYMAGDSVPTGVPCLRSHPVSAPQALLCWRSRSSLDMAFCFGEALPIGSVVWVSWYL